MCIKRYEIHGWMDDNNTEINKSVKQKKVKG